MGVYVSSASFKIKVYINTNKIIMLPMSGIKILSWVFYPVFFKKQTKQVDKTQHNNFILLNLFFIFEQVNYTVTWQFKLVHTKNDSYWVVRTLLHLQQFLPVYLNIYRKGTIVYLAQYIQKNFRFRRLETMVSLHKQTVKIGFISLLKCLASVQGRSGKSPY